MSTVKQLDRAPGGLVTLVRAALPAVPLLNQVPGIRKLPAEDFEGLTYTRPGVEIQRDHVDAYAQVCGFPRKDSVPVTYPHILAFGLHMAIMSDPIFPFAAMGMVHLENTITAHRAIGVGESLDLEVTCDPARPHAKGILLDLRARADVAGETVWESVSTYLRRGLGDESAPRGLTIDQAPSAGSPGVDWQLPGDLGRTYARVSGDHNPIHLYPLTARALGFKRQIIHGMWSKARCVAALENRMGEQADIEVVFKKPIFLPGTVSFAHHEQAGSHAFALTNPRDGAPHLQGRIT